MTSKKVLRFTKKPAEGDDTRSAYAAAMGAILLEQQRAAAIAHATLLANWTPPPDVLLAAWLAIMPVKRAALAAFENQKGNL